MQTFLDIPYFQTVIIMSTKCDFCGYKSNDVKSGGVTQDLGCRLTVKIEEVGGNFKLLELFLMVDDAGVF